MTRTCCKVAKAAGATMCSACGRSTATGRRNPLKVHEETLALLCLTTVALGVVGALAHAATLRRDQPRIIEVVPTDDGTIPLEEPIEARAKPVDAVEPGPVPGPDSPESVVPVAAAPAPGHEMDDVAAGLIAAWTRGRAAGGGEGGGEGTAPAAVPGAGPPRILSVASVAASTYTYTTGPASYEPRNAVDGDRSTGWQVSNGGVGERIRLDLGGVVRLHRIGVVPGYDKVVADRFGDRWPLNNRVSDVRIMWDGGSMIGHFHDGRDMQWIDLGDVTTPWVTIEIARIYPGSRWNDTVISEIECEGWELAR
jgi:hypothetical protein